MANSPMKMSDSVTLEVTTDQAEPTVAAIAEKDWTSTETNTIVIDRHEDWPTQDYLKNPPARVPFERPHDSI